MLDICLHILEKTFLKGYPNHPQIVYNANKTAGFVQ